jgi:hypothetical protein
MFSAGKFWKTMCGFSAGQLTMYGESSVHAMDCVMPGVNQIYIGTLWLTSEN